MADGVTETFEGGCLCGATRFRVRGPVTNPCFCHCRSCRLATGAPFVAWATFPVEGFEIVAGTLARHRSSAKVERGFCPVCGTALTWAHDELPDILDVTLVALDDPSRVTPGYHIWVSQKLPWVTITDGLPQHAKWGSGPA